MFIHERERESKHTLVSETQAEGEAGPRRDPDAGLDPGTPGSPSGPKAGAQTLSHSGFPREKILLGEMFIPI